MGNIFFDFDGTLVNSQHRLYNLFVELCPECKMTYDEYWNIKRQRINQKDFLKKYFGYGDEKCIAFHQKWLEKVEEPERLKQDFLVDGIREVLNDLSKSNSLYLTTCRQSRELTLEEVNNLGIYNCFTDFIITEQKKTKVQLIKEKVKCISSDVLIGDTGEDIKAAHELGIKSIAVSWGVLNKDILSEYNPDFIAERIEDFDKCSFL